MDDLEPGLVLLVNYGDGLGREQTGRRPVVVVSSVEHLATADQLVTVIPCTTVLRGWPNHVRLTGPIGLTQPTVAITEQIRTIDRTRLLRVTGTVDQRCLREISLWIEDWQVARSA